ncbi:MAG: polysaccharide pyruvyl transferase family protein [Lachnospiraceae bacterium]|nr:polysaccharide pyruvyl transferase family protein [Lachnospiraceae bacterium]
MCKGENIVKKVGILTYHTGYNYGASLQAYALQSVIKNMGIDCEIINFETEDFLASREMFSRKPRRLKEIIKIISRLPYYGSLIKRQNMFDDFTNCCLNISPLYRSEKEVKEHACEYDYIVCGSDQIWNLGTPDAPDANILFFLNFSKKQKRVSYAASFGKWVNSPHHEENIIPWLKEFDKISVREFSGQEYLKAHRIDSNITLDPTILLDDNQYDEICAKRQIERKYVLMFSWNCNNDVITAAKHVSKELGYPLYNLTPPPRAMFSGVSRKLDVGPREFLSLIRNAEFVVTNSFHGTAFSTTFERPYISIVSGDVDPRMESLLKQLGLSDHLVSKDEIDIKHILETDFNIVREKKKALRKDSFDFLKQALEVEQC